MTDQTADIVLDPKPTDPVNRPETETILARHVAMAGDIADRREAEAVTDLLAELSALHNSVPATAAHMIGDSAADPQALPVQGPLPPIPSDDVLNEATDQGLVMLMAAHGVGPATSRENAIELLGKARDFVDDPVDAPAPEPLPAALAEPEDHTGKVWNFHQQKWVEPHVPG